MKMKLEYQEACLQKPCRLSLATPEFNRGIIGSSLLSRARVPVACSSLLMPAVPSSRTQGIQAIQFPFSLCFVPFVSRAAFLSSRWYTLYQAQRFPPPPKYFFAMLSTRGVTIGASVA